MQQGFDYIVVGGGSAGCVLANRLSANSAVKVALIEAGPSDRSFPANIKSSLPVGNIFLLPHGKYNWQYQFTGGAGVNGRSIPCPRGRMLGGCSSVNGSVYIRGHRSDYDDWAALGNEGWGYEDVLPAYKRMENRVGGDPRFHGTGGELNVEKPKASNMLAHAFVESALGLGHARNDDFNGATQDGFGMWDVNQRNGVRLSSSRAFLHPIEARRNLTLFTDALVERIDFRGTTATGVTMVRGGQRESLTASAEVILCGGTVNSPQLLMLSGIGPQAQLRRHGLRVIADRSGVGANLQDHPSLAVGVADPSANAYALSWRSMHRIAASPLQYLMNRTGLLASNAAESGGFLRSVAGLDRPDIQLTFLAGLKGSARAIPREHGVMILVSVLRPRTRGFIELTSARAEDRPLLHPAFMEDIADVHTLVRGVRETRRILAASPIGKYLGAELVPGARAESDAELEAAVRNGLMTVYHPVGTCKMGPARDPEAVVDAQLRMHGLDRLRVADASIMPNIIGGNTSAPAMMIGERAAQFILRADVPRTLPRVQAVAA